MSVERTGSPDLAEVMAAAARIATHATVTPTLRSSGLDARAGCRLSFKSEHLQRAGAFKFRGACNAVWSLEQRDVQAGVVTHSSGNHGAALALAASTRGMSCHVVVPENAVAAKVRAIETYGAQLVRCAPTIEAREAACAVLQSRTGARLVHPYTDPLVIAGQGTAMLELLGDGRVAFDAVVVPVGGGGLAAGTALVLAALSPSTQLYLAEPSGAADTVASLAAGRRITDGVPDTLCDGLRGKLGAPNFQILHALGAKALAVDDAATVTAMRLLWERMKQLVEPSSAIALAAVLAHPALFAGQRVGIVLSGGNVDLDGLPAGFACGPA